MIDLIDSEFFIWENFDEMPPVMLLKTDAVLSPVVFNTDSVRWKLKTMKTYDLQYTLYK